VKFAPRRISSANVQAEFYRQCMNAGIKCHLEYRVDNCRFDAVIVHNDEIVFIIEAKNYKPNPQRPRAVKQLEKYSQYGIPVILLKDFSSIEPAILKIREVIPL